jgi:GAF domain-containing protein
MNQAVICNVEFLEHEWVCLVFAVPLIAKSQVKGILELFLRQTLAPDQEWKDFLEALATQAAIAIDNAELFERLQSANYQLNKAYEATIEGWSKALELRS